MLRMHVDDESVHIVHERVGKVCFHIFELLFEFRKRFGLFMKIDDEFSERFIIETCVIVNLLGYLRDQR